MACLSLTACLTAGRTGVVHNAISLVVPQSSSGVFAVSPRTSVRACIKHVIHLVCTIFSRAGFSLIFLGSADLEITVKLLIQVDKLVQLIESPVFTCEFAVIVYAQHRLKVCHRPPSAAPGAG